MKMLNLNLRMANLIMVPSYRMIGVASELELVTILEKDGVVHKLEHDNDKLEHDKLDHGLMEPGQET